ncbi:MAG: ATP-binding protein [Spirochaetaceae bacterium]|nr:ATP-binding protein [Spirochaetaceae bacterium]
MHRYLTDYILDITQNSFEASSTNVVLKIDEEDRYFSFFISDDGSGMSQEVLSKVLDPYYTNGIKHKSRKVGLGLSFLVQTIKDTGGTFDIKSKIGEGTVVMSSFDLCNIDTPPIGDIPTTLLALISSPQAKNFSIERNIKTKLGNSSYQLARSELIDVLGDLNNSSSLFMLREYLRSQEDSLVEYYVDRKLIY